MGKWAIKVLQFNITKLNLIELPTIACMIKYKFSILADLSNIRVSGVVKFAVDYQCS